MYTNFSQGSNRLFVLLKNKNTPSASIPSRLLNKSYKLSLGTLLILAIFPAFSETLVLSPVDPIDPSDPKDQNQIWVAPDCVGGKCTVDLSTNPPINISSIIVERTLVHDDYIVKLPNSGFTINNDEEDASGWPAGIDFSLQSKNGFSVIFDGDLTINKTGLLMRNEGGAVFNLVGNSIKNGNEPGPFIFKNNLTINLGSADKGVKAQTLTAALNVLSGDFFVEGNTTISVQNLLNYDGEVLDFSGIALGGGYDHQNITERKYQFKDINVEQITVEGTQNVVDGSNVYGIHINKKTAEKDVFINRLVSANKISICSVKLHTDNALPAKVFGIEINGGELTVNDYLTIDGISVGSEEKSEEVIASAIELNDSSKLAIGGITTIDTIQAVNGEIAMAVGVKSVGSSIDFLDNLTLTNVTANGSETIASGLEAGNGKITVANVATIKSIVSTSTASGGMAYGAVSNVGSTIDFKKSLILKDVRTNGVGGEAVGLAAWGGKISVGEEAVIEGIVGTNGANAMGIQVWPGEVTINGDLNITGIEGAESYSLWALSDDTGPAIINAENASNIVIVGDICSKTLNDQNNSLITLAFNDENGLLKAFSEVDGQNEINLTFSDGARWELVTSNPSKYLNKDHESFVTTLTLNDGEVYFGGTKDKWKTTNLDNDAVKLNIGELNGTGGTFYIRTDIDGEYTDQLIAKKGTGNHKLYVRSTGKEPSKESMDSFLAQLHSGDATFELANEGKYVAVDVGTYVYELAERTTPAGAKEWYLVRAENKQPDPTVDPTPDDPTPLPVYSPTAEAVLAMAGMGAQSGFYQNQLTDVRKRLGEIRGGVRDGLWASVAGQKDRVSGFAGTHFKQDVYRFNFGADAVVGDWILGGNFKYTNADQKTRDTFFKAKGEAHSEGLNLYATWQNEKGCYADFILSADRYHQRINNTMLDGTGVKGTYRNFGLGVSAEIGKKFSLNEAQTWFAEPQLQLSYYHVKGDDFTMSNGMKVKQGNFNSLTGRVGVAAGHEVRTAYGKPKGQVYLRTGLKHEFLGKQTLHVNDVKFRDKLVGTRAYYGLATDWNLTKNLKVYGHVERENGSHYTKEIEVMAGVKYSF